MQARTFSELDAIDKGTILDARGRSLKDAKRDLRPRFAIVWRDLLAGHLVLVATAAAVVVADGRSLVVSIVAALAGALVIGFALAYIQLFIHEAAHFNIAPTRRANDVLANALIGIFVGQDIAAYRAIHFDHHRYLGTPQDTERTYFEALDVRFVIESLTGIKILKVLLGRQRVASVDGAERERSAKKSLLNRQLVLGAALHACIVGASVWRGAWALVAAWLIGVGVVFPFFAAVRQVLEHRDSAARKELDYREVPHGAYTRLFAAGPLAATLGGAGFARHLLHHWEPQISYTQLAALEEYLEQTPVGDLLRRHRTTYLATFATLLRAK